MALAVLVSLTALGKTIDLPADGVEWQASTLPGYSIVTIRCISCHSAEYARYQPPNAARPYWETMVKRMKGVFNAPLQEADMPIIVDYLVKTYGNEQAKK